MASLTVDQTEFQDYARRWLDENRPPPPDQQLPITPLEIMTEAHRDYLQEWQAACSSPPDSVGRRLSASSMAGEGMMGFQRIANQEMASSAERPC